MSLAEVLIGLAITASLLTAVGVAFTSTLSAMETSDQFFRASQAARVSMNQILNGIRSCQSGVVDTRSLDLTGINGETRTYTFDPTSQVISLSIANQTSAPVPLAHSVTNATFTTDGASIAVSITVQVNDSKVTLTGSAVPRRKTVYAD
jgi:Tfp pilus assembly protein PilW